MGNREVPNNAKWIIMPGIDVFLPDGSKLKVRQTLNRDFIAAGEQLQFRFSYDDLNLKFFLTRHAALKRTPPAGLPTPTKDNLTPLTPASKTAAPSQKSAAVKPSGSDGKAEKPGISPKVPAGKTLQPEPAISPDPAIKCWPPDLPFSLGQPASQAAKDDIRRTGTVGGLEIGRTVLYHNVYGAGQVSGYDPHGYIYVRFSSRVDEVHFKYPCAIGTILFQKKTKDLIEREKRSADSAYVQENVAEMEHFYSLARHAYAQAELEAQKAELEGFARPDKADIYSASVLKRERTAAAENERWLQISNQPVFGRLDFRKNNRKESLYIGKLGVEGKVVEWRDQRCAPFYKYGFLNGQDGLQISLVRNIESKAGVYLGFVDSFSDRKRKDDATENYYADEFLARIIEINRSDKSVHDIIQTIQKNQYDMITAPFSRNLVVNGCAGSGKTMILYHRLSYMIFNDQQLDPARITVVSPTELLRSFSDDLSMELGIDKISRVSLRKFHADLLTAYSRANRFPLQLSAEIWSDGTALTASQIGGLYSIDIQNQFREEVQKIMTVETPEWHGFIGEEMRVLTRRIQAFLPADTIVLDFQNARTQLMPQLEALAALQHLIEALPRENVQKKAQNLKERAQDPNIKDTTLAGKAAVLRHLDQEWRLNGDTIYTGKERETSLDDQLFTPVFAYFNAMGKDFRENKGYAEFPHLADRFPDVSDYYLSLRRLAERLERFERFRKGEPRAYGTFAVLRLTNEIRRMFVADSARHYDFERYFWLVGFREAFGDLQDAAAYVFIDEYQDLSPAELALYRRVLPRTCFNLFGDPQQTIHPKGMGDPQELDRVLPNATVFAIRENYRNPVEVTRFISSQLKIEMRPVGIRGSVNRQAAARHILAIPETDNVHTVLIVKDQQAWETYQTLKPPIDRQKINLVFDDTAKIMPNVVNVMPVVLAKGLEFDTVYAFDKGLTAQEKYVAYTRALRDLVVLS